MPNVAIPLIIIMFVLGGLALGFYFLSTWMERSQTKAKEQAANPPTTEVDFCLHDELNVNNLADDIIKVQEVKPEEAEDDFRSGFKSRIESPHRMADYYNRKYGINPVTKKEDSADRNVDLGDDDESGDDDGQLTLSQEDIKKLLALKDLMNRPT